MAGTFRTRATYTIYLTPTRGYGDWLKEDPSYEMELVATIGSLRTQTRRRLRNGRYSNEGLHDPELGDD